MGRTLRTTWLRSQEWLALAAASGGLALVLVPPLLAVARDLAATRDALELLADRRLWWLLGKSVLLGGAVTTIAVVAGVPMGVLFARAAFPLRRSLFAVHVAIALLPPFLPALGWFHLCTGTVAARALFSEWGLVFVLAGCFMPIVTSLTALGVRGVDASLEDAARIAGGPVRAAARILVPLAMPAICLAAILVFALALSELGVAMLLRVDVYPAVVFARLGGMDFAPGEAALFVLPLILISLLLLGLERRFAGWRAIASLAGWRDAGEPLFRFHPAILGAALLAAIISAAPLVALLVGAAGRFGVSEIVRWAGVAPWNSLRASVLAASAMCGLALVLGHAIVRRPKIAVWLDAVAMLAFVLPPSILGVGLIGAWNRPSTSWVYASSGILVFGFVARYSAVATRTFAAQVAHVPQSMEDAAKTVGASYLRRLGLLARLAPRGLVGAFVLGLVFALRDLETAVLFYPPGGEPLTVRIFTLEANGPPAVVAALSMVQIFMTFAVAALGAFLLHARRTA